MTEAYEFQSFASIKPVVSECLLPPEEISIRDHEERNLYLPAGKNPFPGLVDFSKSPYLHEPLDALILTKGLKSLSS